MTLILEIRRGGHDGTTVHCRIAEFPATVGRGYHNTLILDDPAAAAEHITIRAVSDGWRVTGEDIDLNGQPVAADGAVVRSGDVLRLGGTEIGFYRPDHPVPPPRKPEKLSRAVAALARPGRGAIGLALALAVTQSWAWLEVWSDEPRVTQSAVAASVAATIVFWAALWAAAGRLSGRRGGFMAHVAAMSAYVLAGVVGWYVEAYASFLSGGAAAGAALVYALHTLLLAVLLDASLQLASGLSRHRRRLSALLLAAAVLAGVYVTGRINDGRFSTAPPYPSKLEPYLSHLPPADSPAAFVRAVERHMEGSALFAAPKP